MATTTILMTPNARQRLRRGFTLIELMIVVAIVGVLAMVAYPSYIKQVQKSRRADAITALNRIAQAQERWRANQSTYSNVLTSAGLNVPNPSSGYYTLQAVTPATSATAAAIAGAASASSYSAIATAAGGQTRDAGCQVLKLNMLVGNVTYMAGATASTLADTTTSSVARRCWNQ
jgi:type IV pilus assembly protein PilE